MSQASLAREVGVTPQAISKLVAGGSAGSAKVYLIARALETTPEYLLGESDDPEGSVPSVSSDERILEIPVLDMEYGMGATYLENVDPEVRLEPFPLSFIRRFSKARADQLFIAEGLGDSMSPTIGTNDLLLIDRSADTLRVADQIWAFSFGGAGMVKRLRPRPDGSIAILSDNPSVAEDKAVDDELFLIGRVVAIVRKV
jgi:phage repressor protein C with HTH and peptisase S24 domain|tara:strand:- start:935 stop:1534 length:600 start_codon:yes stop_codon:yes gene_type:complete